MKGTLIEAFNHVEEIGPHVIEGHFDLSKWISIMPITLPYNCEIKRSQLLPRESLDVSEATFPCRGYNPRARLSLTLSQ